MRLQEIFEGVRGQITFQVAVRGSQSGQMDLTLYARISGEIVAHIDYSEYQGDVAIQWLEGSRQHKGVGTALVRHLQSLYPDREIEWGSTTEQGEQLRTSLPMQQIVDPEIEAKFERLKAVKFELMKLGRDYDLMSNQGIGQNRDRLLAMGARMNDLHDEEWDLECETRDLKPSRSIIRQANESSKIKESNDTPDVLYVEQVRAMQLPATVELLVVGTGRRVEIRSIYVTKRNSGAGRKTMNILTALADQMKITLELEPLSAIEFGWEGDEDEDFSDSLPQAALRAWYTRLGFKTISGDVSDDSDSPMVRLPN